MVMHLPCVLAGVSPAVQDILAAEFGRVPLLLPNGIDAERFAPGPRAPEAPVRAAAVQGVSARRGLRGAQGPGQPCSLALPDTPEAPARPPSSDSASIPPAQPAQLLTAVRPRTVLLVGNPTLPLKGFPTAVAALAAVGRALPLHVRWVCQHAPTEATVPGLAAAGLDVEFVVAPAQEDLPRLYRGHDAFLFTSRWGPGPRALER
jgi:glycosyltransferase involved in cell wall biosynthesis